MVKKLFKHEFIAWLRTFWVVFLVILTLAGAHRIFQIFENDSTAYEVANVLTIIAYSISLFVAILLPIGFAFSRFYKNLFTGEGYLSLTLPVTAGQHLWTKTLTATAMSLATGMVCILSVMLITAGDLFSEICKAAAYLLGKIPSKQVWHIVGYCLEALVLIIVSLFSSHILFDACICLGQRFRKNRVGAAIGVYFGYYYFGQLMATIFGVVIEVLEENGTLQPLYDFMDKHGNASIHIGFAVAILLAALQALVCFWVCHRTLTRKLNLE